MIRWIADRARQLIDFLYAAPHGVLAMSPDIPGLVQTSTNLAVVERHPGAVAVPCGGGW